MTSEQLAERALDLNFEDEVIDRVEANHDGGWTICRDSVCFGAVPATSFEVKVGMVARFYGGAGPGSRVYGLDLDGSPIFYQTAGEREAERQAWLADYEERKRKTALEPKLPEPQIPGFEWTEDMREISGFGGGYERLCRSMVSAGCKWWSDHPGADPKFHGFKNVYGIVAEDNDDAKALTKAVVAPAKDDCTGAMHQASISHVFGWKQLGSWPAYQEKMREPRHD